MSVPNHFSSPKLSNWQSAVAKVVTSPSLLDKPFDAKIARSPVDFAHDYIAAAAAAAAGTEPKNPTGPLATATRCAKAAFALAEARILGDEDAARSARAKLAAFGDCDPKWAECILEFVAHYTVTQHADVPYRKWKTIDDFVEPTLPTACTIAVIGDWGTGDIRAQTLLEEIARLDIDVLIHLGDIYYSCSSAEAQRFRLNLEKAFGGKRPLIRTLCGNHDMYSGGAPYYALLEALGQPASFFCLRNEDWQLLAADTGYNDFDVREEGKVATWVQHYDDNSRYSELAWHQHKLATAGKRRTILLTHHQPFSSNSAIDANSAINSRLLGQFAPYLQTLALWLWGHEHNQVIYNPFAKLQRGRCIGASAVPVASDENPYAVAANIKGKIPTIVAEASKLTVDPATDLYKLGFAILQLDGKSCRETYYELNPSDRSMRSVYSNSV